MSKRVDFILDSEKPATNPDVPDPTGPAARKGVLISFRTGKTMEIPEKDIVCIYELLRKSRKVRFHLLNGY